jgi:hypothetical protein
VTVFENMVLKKIYFGSNTEKIGEGRAKLWNCTVLQMLFALLKIYFYH